jgi:hypothetical protein
MNKILRRRLEELLAEWINERERRQQHEVRVRKNLCERNVELQEASQMVSEIEAILASDPSSGADAPATPLETPPRPPLPGPGEEA